MSAAVWAYTALMAVLPFLIWGAACWVFRRNDRKENDT